MNTVKTIIDNNINELISDIYDYFNSTCIIDYDTLTIETPEQTLKFNSLQHMRLFILNEIKLSLNIE